VRRAVEGVRPPDVHRAAPIVRRRDRRNPRA
jgi:hypothetical protein